jgi:O-antigen ligase
VTAVAGFGVMTASWGPLNAAIDTPTSSALVDRMQAVGGRSIHWPAMWDAAWREPLLGWGWMRVGAAQQAVALNHARSHEWISFSHNLFLDLLVWNGVIIGGVVCVAIIAWIISRCLRCRDPSTWAMLAAGGVLLTHALVEYPHAYLYFLLPMAVFIGVVEAQPEHTGPNAQSIPTIPNWTYALVSVAMAGCLAWVCVEYLEAI